MHDYDVVFEEARIKKINSKHGIRFFFLVEKGLKCREIDWFCFTEIFA